jgi:hypothetical protein
MNFLTESRISNLESQFTLALLTRRASRFPTLVTTFEASPPSPHHVQSHPRVKTRSLSCL